MNRYRAAVHWVVRGGLVVGAIAAGVYVHQRLEREARNAENRVTLAGELIGVTPAAPCILVALHDVEGEPAVGAYQVHARSGPFKFVLPAGTYTVHAFEDVDRDLVYDEGERAAHHGGSEAKPIDGAGGSVHGDLQVDLAAGAGPIGTPIDLSAPALDSTLEYARVRSGEVVSITDPRFTQENGAMGLWEPTRFVREVGFGVYLLADFDPDRLPVLFVHGAGGHPREFEYLAGELDDEHFQPWVFSYPSAMRLDRTGAVLESMIQELRVRHGFERLCIVAHSMGGLVARAFVNRLVAADPTQTLVRVLVTVSTPWRGHRAAEWGVDLSPVSIPSWIDMAPGSDFQDALFAVGWPALPRHYLFFGYGGRGSVLTGGNADGAVSLSSQLDYRAQDRAEERYGFDADHRAILTDERVARRLGDVLATALPAAAAPADQ